MDTRAVSKIKCSSELVSQEAIRLQWLIRMRWAALVSLAVIFLGANYLLELGLYTRIVAEILGVGCVTNLFLVWVLRRSPEYPQLIAGLTLILDVLLLTALLFVSGGYTNPFSMVYLAYVALAAVVADARWTWGVFAVSLLCFFALFFFHIPLEQLATHSHHVHSASSSGFSLHLHGMLLAFVCIGLIGAAFVTRMNREIAEQARVITDLRRLEDERKRLVSLATLTAGVTHELATPVATMSLIGDDLARELRDSPRWGEDVAVLQSELARCGNILQRMRASNSELQGEMPHSFVLADLLDELQREFASAAVPVSFEVGASDSSGPAATRVYSLRQALIGSLQALVRNAVQASVSGGSVVCRTEVGATEITFRVRDSGLGMSAEVRDRVGEPFFTLKEPGQGMGLGLYLTKLFAQQVGGAVQISSMLGRGSEVVLTIPKTMRI